MNFIINFLENLGAYIIPAFLTLVLIVLIINILIQLRKHKKIATIDTYNKKNVDFADLIISTDNRAFLIIRHSDCYPMYTNGKLDELVGVDFSESVAFFESLIDNYNYEDNIKIRELFLNWDRNYTISDTFYNIKTNKWIEMKISKTRDDELDLIEFADVTQNVEKINQLHTSIEEAELISQSKTEFLSKTSHDIRTPMNGIIGILTLMRRHTSDELLIQYIEKAESLSAFLLNLINDVLDISKIESGKFELAEETFSLHNFAEKFNTMFRKRIEEKGLQFNIEKNDIKNPYVIGDEFRISQIIINLLSNAIKFTEKGSINLKISEISVSNGVGSYLFSVTDTGKGIENAFIKNLFKPFEQENSKIARKYGGSGLGMAIADQMTHLMGGEIVVNSVVGKGTDFYVYINLPISENISDNEDTLTNIDTNIVTEDKIDKEFTWNNIKILMAEDNEINAEIAVEILEAEGAKIDVAVNGEDVVEKFAERGKGYYDIILMDVQMPIMNGWNATKLIRKMTEIDGDTIPIIALSADAFIEDKRKSIEVGMDEHLSKPIDYVALKKTVAGLLKR